jgi:hypothetical protein
VVLNYSTDGVSLEVASNREQQKLYLAGLSDHLSFTDTNHNIKNSQYQEIGGSGETSASICRYCLDVMLLKMSGASREVLRPDDFASDALPLKLASSSIVRALLELETNDTGNKMVSRVAVCNEMKPLSDFFYLVTLTQVTALSLLFTRMHSFAVNCPDAMPHERVFFHWLSTLWFTSFHSSGSTMLTNKRNMVLESVAVLFLATRSDVFKLRLCTSEANEHTYGMLRQMCRKFNAEQFIRLVDKLRFKLDAIFGSNLETVCNKSRCKGYLNTFLDFLNCLIKGAKHPLAEPCEVDLSKPAVHQLWGTVSEVINVVNEVACPFMKKIGIVNGNGLSLFAVKMDMPNDLCKLLVTFCEQRPKRNWRDLGNSADDWLDIGEEDDVVESDDKDDEAVEIGAGSIPVDVLNDMIAELNAAEE